MIKIQQHRFLHRSLFVLIAAALSLHTAIAGPDISNRTLIPLNQLGLPALPDRTPTAVATDLLWAAMATSRPIPPAPFPNFDIQPVQVTGPWSGAPYLDLDIPPPYIGDELIEEFGAALAIQGYRIAIGVPQEHSYDTYCSVSCFCCWVDSHFPSGGGKVRLYLFDGSQFQPERTITTGGISDRFGQAIALERWNLLVGSPGAAPGNAHVFDPDTGTLIDSFVSPDVSGADLYGSTVALDDDLALVGAPGDNTVYVYRDDGNGNWSAAGTLTSPGSGSEFGAAIAADGDFIIVGAPGIDKAYVFADAGTSAWPVVAELTGTNDSDFGRAVALADETAFVGAPQLIAGPIRIGSVDQYDHAIDGSWPHTGQLTSAAPVDGDNYGIAMSSSARILTVAQHDTAGQYVYTSPANIYDPDGDGAAYLADNCLGVANPDQLDTDNDGMGNACDDDDDGDGFSDTDEAIAGSDPLDPDTDNDGLLDGDDPYPLLTDGDGDGFDDGVDNCPAIANDQSDYDTDGEGDLCDTDIDGDSISNADELLAGTDPENHDTDGDGHWDHRDDFPLDYKDGWNEVYRFQLYAVGNVAAGDGVVLASNPTDLRSYVQTPTGWEEGTPPPLSIPTGEAIYLTDLKKDRAVIYTYNANLGSVGTLHLFEWSAVSGWSFLDSVVTDQRIWQLSIDGETVAATIYEGSGNDGLWIYKLTGGDLLKVAERTVFNADSLLVSGDTVATGSEAWSIVHVFEAADAYAGDNVTLANSGVGLKLLEFGVGNIVAASNSFFYDLEKSGSWTLTPNTLDPRYTDIGDDGLVGVYGQIPSYNLFPQRLTNASSLGSIQNRSFNADFETNDVIVTRVGDSWVDIFVLEDVVQPPGC